MDALKDARAAGGPGLESGLPGASSLPGERKGQDQRTRMVHRAPYVIDLRAFHVRDPETRGESERSR